MIDRDEARAWLGSVAGDLWLMEPRHLQAFLASAGQETEARSFRIGRGEDLPFELRDGVAHIPIAGVMLRSVPWWAGNATSTPRVREAVEAAIAEPRVRSILLRISSPGGSSAGVNDLADAVHHASKIKPIHAHAQDMAGSAAYWVGSQASRFTAEPTTEIGSIGAYRAIFDDSQRYEQAGVKVHLVRSGPQKGTGHPGVSVSDAELAHQQSLIDGLADLFVGAVARGRRRGREDIEPSANGATWLAADAVKRGLIDAVEPAELAHQSLTVAGGSDLPPARLANPPAASVPAQAQEPSMSNPVTPPVAPEAPASAPAAASTNPPNASAASAEGAAEVSSLRSRTLELEEKLASANALNAVLQSSITQLQKDRKLDAIDAGVAAGKISPASVEVWTKLAESEPHTDAGLAAVKGQITKLPTLTRSNIQGVVLKDERDSASAAAVFSTQEIDELRSRGKDPDRIARSTHVEILIGEGKAKLKDGRVVNLQNYLDGKSG